MKRILLGLFLALLPVAIAQAGAVPVEVRSGAAHDGLTQKLVEALERALSSDEMFQLAPENTNGSLRILIPSNVESTPEPDGQAITAVAEFSLDGKVIGQIAVTCNDRSIDVCAGRIVSIGKKVLASARRN